MFETEAADDLQITLEVEPEKEYKVYVNDTNIGKLKSSLSGKISFSIELDAGETAKVPNSKIDGGRNFIRWDDRRTLAIK